MRLLSLLAPCLAAFCLAPCALAASPGDRFGATVDEILAQPYQSAYVPLGLDGAFDQAVPNTAPAEDYTSGSIPGSPDLPAWPAVFSQALIHSADGAPLLAQVAVHPGSHPGVVVVHGFNTHGYASVIRWAALLYARGYDVIASDQRDFYYESNAGLRLSGLAADVRLEGVGGRARGRPVPRRRKRVSARSASSASAKGRRTRCWRSRSTRRRAHGSSRPG